MDSSGGCLHFLLKNEKDIKKCNEQISVSKEENENNRKDNNIDNLLT